MARYLWRENPVCAKINGTPLSILTVTDKLLKYISVNLLYQGTHKSSTLCWNSFYK